MKKDYDNKVVLQMRSLREISGLFIFFYEEILHTKKSIKSKQSDFHSDIFICLKSIKSKQATFTHKKHKMQISDFHSDIFIRLKRGQKDKWLSFS